MPILSIRHITHYRYRNPVALGEHRMMFRPRESYDQRILLCDLAISPTPTHMRSMHDVFGNCVGVAGFSGRTRDLVFDSFARLEHSPLPAFSDRDGEVEAYAGALPVVYDPDDAPDLERSIRRNYADPQGVVSSWARRFVNLTGKTRLQDLLSAMTQAIYADFKYCSRPERGVQTPIETLASRSGSCRDYAVLMMEIGRAHV